MEENNYKFKRFDLVAGINLRLEWGDNASLIGIVDACDDKTVSLSIVWSQHNASFGNPQPAWFIGDEIEFKLKNLIAGIQTSSITILFLLEIYHFHSTCLDIIL